MICNIKVLVECWTAPRDYHRGDRDSNAALSLRKTSESMRHKLKVNLISSKLRLYPVSGASCCKTLTHHQRKPSTPCIIYQASGGADQLNQFLPIILNNHKKHTLQFRHAHQPLKYKHAMNAAIFKPGNKQTNKYHITSFFTQCWFFFFF